MWLLWQLRRAPRTTHRVRSFAQSLIHGMKLVIEIKAAEAA